MANALLQWLLLAVGCYLHDNRVQITIVVKQAQDTLHQSVAAIRASCQQQLKVAALQYLQLCLAS
jgi:hypothetical protein